MRTAHRNEARLTLLPSVPVWREGDLVVFDRKFYEGMRLHAEEWPGSVTCVMRVGAAPPPDFGLVEVHPAQAPFDLVMLDDGERIGLRHLDGASVVLCSGDDFDQFHLSKLCRRHGIKCVYAIEYTPETRRQILELQAVNPVVKARRALYLRSGEKKRRKAFALADAIQANGAAAYEEYAPHHDNCIVYYDTRMHEGSLITDAELQARLHDLSAARPLRLGFSGRLIQMKGADHLVQLAAKLRARGVDFTLSIFGAGALEGEMRREIERLSLQGHVDMRGAVDFHEELIPTLKAQIDVYVVLHRQSDPSCTYLETLSCGIPIVGYDNRAFQGLMRQADIGWLVRMDDLLGATELLERLSRARDEIRDKSLNAVRFARRHDFGATFRSRNRQLVGLLDEAPQPTRASAQPLLRNHPPALAAAAAGLG